MVPAVPVLLSVPGKRLQPGFGSVLGGHHHVRYILLLGLGGQESLKPREKQCFIIFCSLPLGANWVLGF